MKSLSHVRLFATPWTAAYQTPPSMEFSRQEYWSGVPLPSPVGLREGPKSKVPLPSCDVKGMYRHPGQVMLILNWLRWCWLPFSTAGQAALFGRSLRSAHGRCGRYGVSNRLFGILPHGRFVSCLPFTYSVIYFYHYELIDIYFIH